MHLCVCDHFTAQCQSLEIERSTRSMSVLTVLSLTLRLTFPVFTVLHRDRKNNNFIYIQYMSSNLC